MDLRTGASAQPVSWDRHKTCSWRKPESYVFARALRSVSVTLTEAVSAASCFPLVFVPGPTGPALHALLRRGAQGKSPFIGRDGQWQASWLPPRLAVWPFDLVEVSGGHALALHETPDLVVEGPDGTPIFADGDAASLSPDTSRMAALLKTHAEALPATARAAAALDNLGLLTKLDEEDQIFAVEPVAAADLDEAGVLTLHRAGALALLHAALVSLAHLPWMEKAERHMVTSPAVKPHPLPDRKRTVAGSGFLTALAADVSADTSLIQFPGLNQS